jgi:DNA repair protein RadA/Sms
MPKATTQYRCTQCQTTSATYLGRCPACGAWNSLEKLEKAPDTKPGKGLHSAQGAQPLAEVTASQGDRFTSGFDEVDRVLGGGWVPGGYCLLGGDPGIGKSTLMLQVAEQVAKAGRSVLYVAGEESPAQIKLRADRLGLSADAIWVYPETQIPAILAEVKRLKPSLVVIDSIQTLNHPDYPGGGLTQIRECAQALMTLAKTEGATVVLIGHVTKEGAVAGPKQLEHMVDTVLYFEGDPFGNLRLLRAVKNRFGATHEVGVFDMRDSGFSEVTNPSVLFLGNSRQAPGSVVTATVSGSRPILVEVQALVGQAAYANPRRLATGLDNGRLYQIVAILERWLGVDFSRQDIYVNVVGGMRIQEPAADLAVALAIISCARDVTLPPGTVVVGELGLTGEVRPVSQLPARAGEAAKLGFDRFIAANPEHSRHPVRSLMEAVQAVLTPARPTPEPVL